ncbi:MAG: siderophore ABC transporter substrate-binding protein [Tissierellia bacterium]|nr:siderophore ABC transporter substrate-binding protein [Tissierellia bacterium]
MKLKKISLLLLTAVIVFTLGACTETSDQLQSEESESVQAEEPTNITINHELDKVTIDLNPKRIVTFDYGFLDALDTMGIDIVGLPKASLPDYLSKYKGDNYTDLGTLKEPNFELLFELEPDVIFISERQLDLYVDFKEIAPTIYVPIDGSNYFTSFKNNMNILGQVFGKETEVSEKIREIELAMEKLKSRVMESEKTALFVMANEGNLSVYGEGSRYGFVYDEFGFMIADENIESSTHGQKISFEYLVEKNPNYLIVLDRGAALNTGSESAGVLINNDLMESTEAVQKDNIIYLDSAVWYVTTGGIQGTIKMIKDISEGI